ncbi:MAG: ABC transporter permease subunit [Deltaproteobacteria bacterium]|nr:ABC transporter permease subunit [Deltaproteobacteria bacterium]
MSLRAARAAVALTRRELLEGLRDPSVLFSTVLMPVLLGPLVFWAAVQLLLLTEGRAEQEPPTTLLEVRPARPEDAAAAAAAEALLRAYLSVPAPRRSIVAPAPDVDEAEPAAPPGLGQPSAPPGTAALRVLPLPADQPDIRAALSEDIADIGIIATVQGELWSIELLSAGTRDRSVAAQSAAKARLSVLKGHRRKAILDAWGVDPADVRPLRLEAEDRATPSEVLGRLLGMILPMMVVVNIIAGATAPSVEAVAGERERGTLETTLVSGAPRLAILGGKVLTIICWTLFTAAGSLLGLGLSVAHGMATLGAELDMRLELRADQVLLGLLVLTSALPVVPLANLLVTLPARNSRQAQTIAGAMVMPMLALTMLSLDERTAMGLQTAAVPMLNVVLAGRAALSAELQPAHAALATAANLGISAALLAGCAWAFRGERLVLGIGGGLGLRAALGIRLSPADPARRGGP